MFFRYKILVNSQNVAKKSYLPQTKAYVHFSSSLPVWKLAFIDLATLYSNFTVFLLVCFWGGGADKLMDILQAFISQVHKIVLDTMENVYFHILFFNQSFKRYFLSDIFNGCYLIGTKFWYSLFRGLTSVPLQINLRFVVVNFLNISMLLATEYCDKKHFL